MLTLHVSYNPVERRILKDSESVACSLQVKSVSDFISTLAPSTTIPDYGWFRGAWKVLILHIRPLKSHNQPPPRPPVRSGVEFLESLQSALQVEDTVII